MRSSRISTGFAALAALALLATTDFALCAAKEVDTQRDADYYADTEPDTDESDSPAERTGEVHAIPVACPRCGRCIPGSSPGGYAPNQATPGQSASPSDESTGPEDPRSFLGDEQYAGLGGNTMSINDAPGGYLENPVVATWFRARYDTAVNNPYPDVAEYFLPKLANLGGPGPSSPTGVSLRSANFQIGSLYGELLLAPRLSVFAQLQVQRTDLFFPNNGSPGTDLIQNGGLGDTIAGFKYALLANECSYLTFQLKTYAPSGDASRGLGTNHVSLEPGLLYLRRLSERAYFQAQVLDWTPINGTDFAGNVINFGFGMGYDLIRTYDGPSPLNPYVAPGLRVTAVTEFVGWTVLNGKKTEKGDLLTDPDVVESAAGYTVGNVKPGFRFTSGAESVYIGAGIGVTTSKFYSDLFRIEYRRMF